MKRSGSPRKARWLVFGIALVVVVGSGAAFAAFPETDVDTYTGCLNTNGSSAGTVGKIKVGDSPLKPCGSNQRQIHLSGGDITDVVAGTGLTGGGDNGAVTLSLDEGYSLPQGCADGQVPKSDGSDAWDCADDAAPQVFTTQPMTVLSIDPLEDATRIAALDVPAGNYSVTAIGHATSFGGVDTEPFFVDCFLDVDPVFPGAFHPTATVRVTEPWAGRPELPSMSMMAAWEIPDPATVEVWCSVADGDASEIAAEFMIQAIRIGD